MKYKDRPVGFVWHPAATPKGDHQFRAGQVVCWRHREFPKHTDGTTAGDRAGWIAEYEARVITCDGSTLCDVQVTKHISTEQGKEFDIDVEEEFVAFERDLTPINQESSDASDSSSSGQ